MNRLFAFYMYLKYRIKAGTPHDVHSPFVFDLFNNVILDSSPYYGYEWVESLRAGLRLDPKSITITDLGTGKNQRTERISQLVNKTVKPKKYSQLLFRLANYFQSQNILELGTSLGLTTLYLSLPRKDSKVYTLEGSPEISKLAENNFKKLNRKNIEILTGEFTEMLPVALAKLQRLDFVYFDGNHRKDPTLEYFNYCLKYATENSIFVFDDIHWSREMHEAWTAIKEHRSVTLTIDLFQFGLVFFNKGLSKQEFTLRY